MKQLYKWRGGGNFFGPYFITFPLPSPVLIQL